MRILALDLGEYKVGYVYGPAGSCPRAQTISVRRNKDERLEEAAARFVAEWLDPFLRKCGVDLIGAEDYLPAGAAPGRTTAAVREGQIILNSHVRAVAALHKIPFRAPSLVTIRKHFCGQVSAAPRRTRGYVRTDREVAQDRAATKEMVIRRATLLGYLPRGSTDDNAADAAAVFDFCSSYFARTPAGFALMASASA